MSLIQWKKHQLNSTGMNFLFTDFLKTKFWLKIFGEYWKKLLKVLSVSKFLYRFAKNAKNWMPSKKLKIITFGNIDSGPNYQSDKILVWQNFYFFNFYLCPTLFCTIRYTKNAMRKKANFERCPELSEMSGN